MNISEVQARLEDMDAIWAEAHNADEGLPDGTYEGVVAGFDFFTKKDTDELFLKVEFTVENHPRFNGFPLEAVQSLSNRERIPYTKAMLARLGVDPDTPAGQLLEALEAVRGQRLELGVKNNERNGRVFTNVYVNARLDAPDDLAPDLDGLPEPDARPGEDALGF